MFTRILVPLDGSELAEQSLPYVRLLASASKIPIDLISVFDPIPPGLADPDYVLYDPQISANFRDEAVAYLDKIKSKLSDTGTPVSSAVYEGNPADHIISEAEKTPDTLIAMATHGRSGIGRWMMGSITDNVLHGTANPLLIIHSREGDAEGDAEVSLKNVIVPLDGSTMAEQILPHMVPVAQSLRLNVILTRVTPSIESYYRFMDPSMAAGINPDRFEEFAGQADADATNYLDQMKERLSKDGISQVESRLLRGGAADAILNLVDGTPDSLIALTTHGRSGVGRWVMGSVADRLVRHAGMPVLVVRVKV
ncbi:MAG: universal stress protein [Chloroflexi bacterium]|nr:universal stress protein [Chloroflexota bacterium]